MNRGLNFDRKKHCMYPKAMGKKIREKLITDFGKTVGDQLWEKTRLKYAELLSDAPSMKGTPHSAGAYTAILFFAYYSILPEKPSIETLEPFTNELFMGSFKTMGKLFNMNRKADLCLLAGIMKSVGKKDAASIRKKPDGFINVQTTFDKENGIIRYKFTQCPNAEFAKKHGFEDIMPLLCNTDYYGMDQLHACLIRTSNCVKGSFCDFCIVADQNPLADKYERIRDEYGFIISKEKKGTDLYVLGQSGRSI